MPQLLNAVGPLAAKHPTDGERIQKATIYVAAPDHHLLVERGHVRLTRGARENRHRPAIDPLFRSAARAYRERVVGVILTGNLDDGTAGLLVVKESGGSAIVQDPKDAMFPGMPSSAISNVEVDYILPLAEIPKRLIELAGNDWRDEAVLEKDIGREPPAEEVAPMLDERVRGEPSAFTCPDCNGTLWEVKEGELLRFRCRVGHAFSPESMAAGYSDGLEGALWSALRALEESASVERRLATEARRAGRDLVAQRYEETAAGREEHANVLRGMLLK
jgi:two-component system chemotaxis response regulator CheB